jgi:hypothetical protein
MVTDLQGSVVLGFVERDIFYIRLIGHVSGPLGAKCASLLQRSLAAGPVVGFFWDAEPPGTIDFSARSGIIRALLENRRHIESMTTLVATKAVAPTVRAMATILDCIVQVAEDADEFHMMMIRAAPYAQAKLSRNQWIRTTVSQRPEAKSTRMRAAPKSR